VGTALTLEIQFYSYLLEYYTTLVACTGAKWQQYSQVTVMMAYYELVRLTQSGPQTFKDQNVELLSPIASRLKLTKKKIQVCIEVS
jgi:hypothetical protein